MDISISDLTEFIYRKHIDMYAKAVDSASLWLTPHQEGEPD
jgi:hypothetical protein